jgi:hypothetical protein
MRIESYFKLVPALVAIGIVMHSCTELTEQQEKFQLNLRWIRAYSNESKEDVVTGLTWGMSFLGASFPTGSVENGIKWKDQYRFTLDLSRIGVSAESLAVWVELISLIKQSDEYQQKGGIDLGRFIALTINSSNHYYALTGVSTDFKKFRSRFVFNDSLAAIVESGVAIGGRVIEIAKGGTLADMAFIAQEGAGSLPDGTFKSNGYEVFDFMPNGQLRFAIYDSSGRLKTAGNPAFTLAGKPAKCLWCHEISIQPPFYAKTEIEGFYSKSEFEAIVKQKMNLVESARARLSSDINFSRKQDHTQLELLYISFMEPSAERLANEWGIPSDQVRLMLQGMATHQHIEFPFLGAELYHRKDIEGLAPYKGLQVPDDARELSSFEPNFLHYN